MDYTSYGIWRRPSTLSWHNVPHALPPQRHLAPHQRNGSQTRHQDEEPARLPRRPSSCARHRAERVSPSDSAYRRRLAIRCHMAVRSQLHRMVEGRALRRRVRRSGDREQPSGRTGASPLAARQLCIGSTTSRRPAAERSVVRFESLGDDGFNADILYDAAC
jgi:hypothetical protein